MPLRHHIIPYFSVRILVLVGLTAVPRVDAQPVREVGPTSRAAAQNSSPEQAAEPSAPAVADGWKSPKKAFFLSLLVPGMGELYVGHNSLTWIVVGMEAGLWSTFILHRMWGRWREDDYRLFAASNGVPIESKPKQYFVDVGNYQDLYAYNEQRRRDRLFEDVYPETEEYLWQWPGDAERTRFEDLRISSDRARNRSELFLLGILVNHIFSAANAALAARRANESGAAQFQLDYLASDAFGRTDVHPRLRVSVPW